MFISVKRICIHVRRVAFRQIMVRIMIVRNIARVKLNLIQIRDNASFAIATALLGTDPIFTTLFDFGTDVRMTATDHLSGATLTLNILDRIENIIFHRYTYNIDRSWK